MSFCYFFFRFASPSSIFSFRSSFLTLSSFPFLLYPSLLADFLLLPSYLFPLFLSFLLSSPSLFPFSPLSPFLPLPHLLPFLSSPFLFYPLPSSLIRLPLTLFPFISPPLFILSLPFFFFSTVLLQHVSSPKPSLAVTSPRTSKQLWTRTQAFRSRYTVRSPQFSSNGKINKD